MRLIDAHALMASKKWENCVCPAQVIRSAPTIEAVPVRHGRWIVTEEYNNVIDMNVVRYTCSACGEYRLSATGLSQATKYCPNCGAKMDKEERQ